MSTSRQPYPLYMNKRLALIAIALVSLQGCSHRQAVRFDYEDYTVIAADTNTINDNCMRDGETISDEGEVINSVNGCWNPDTKTAWIRIGDGIRMFCTLLHELAHKAGHAKPEKEGYEPSSICGKKGVQSTSIQERINRLR